jgi:hypothetical protein
MNLIDDLRYALRVLRKSPAYTVTAIAALGLGIGANTAIFSVFSALLLSSLPYGDPGTLVAVWEDASKMGFPRNTPAPGNFNDWKTGIPAFQDVAAADTYDAILTGDGEPEKIGAASVTSNLFSVCGVQAYAGRRVSGRKACPASDRIEGGAEDSDHPAQTEPGSPRVQFETDTSLNDLIVAIPVASSAHLKSSGANSCTDLRHVSHSWAVPHIVACAHMRPDEGPSTLSKTPPADATRRCSGS